MSAVPAGLAAFGWTIAAVTVVVGGLVSFLAITVAPELSGVARMVIIGAALVLCLPLVWVVKAPFRARSVTVALRFDAEALWVGDQRFPLAELTHLLWCRGTEYARIVLAGSGRRCSLLVGIARPLAGRSADLPEVNADLHRALEAAGLVRADFRPECTRYRRR